VQGLPFGRELVWEQVEHHVVQANQPWRAPGVLESRLSIDLGQEVNQGVVISVKECVKVTGLERQHAPVGVEGAMREGTQVKWVSLAGERCEGKPGAQTAPLVAGVAFVGVAGPLKPTL
jgi:hypothetical protein